MVAAVLAFLGGYLVAAVPLGLVISRGVYGVDIRRYGTGNIGASNIMRNIGAVPAALVALGVFLQGLLPPLIALLLGGSPAAIASAAVGAVVGYGWPVFTGFRNKAGRGVGVSTGAAAVISPWGIALLLVVYGLGRAINQMGLGVLVGFIAYTTFVLYTGHSAAHRTAAVVLLAFLVIRRLDGLSEDLPRDNPWRVISNRVLFDRRPGQTLTGPSGHGP